MCTCKEMKCTNCHKTSDHWLALIAIHAARQLRVEASQANTRKASRGPRLALDSWSSIRACSSGNCGRELSAPWCNLTCPLQAHSGDHSALLSGLLSPLSAVTDGYLPDLPLLHLARAPSKRHDRHCQQCSALAMFADGYVGTSHDATRIRKQQQEREEQRKKYEALQQKTRDKVASAGLRQFGASKAEAYEAAFKNETVGLVTRDEFMRKRTTIQVQPPMQRRSLYACSPLKLACTVQHLWMTGADPSSPSEC